MTALLELRDVEVVYGRRGRIPVRAVAGASLQVERGQIIGLVGESGCGKSSLARVGVGLVPPSSGEVLFEGEPLTPLGRAARPRREARLQMVFQNPYASLNPRRRVGTQIRAAMSLGGRKEARDERVAELLEQVGMSPGAARRYPHEFSGGQRQRIAIARALAADPSCIVLDEPLSSLDASAQAQIANLLVRLSRELDLGLLLISHDLAIVRHVCDAISVMYLGLIVESGPAAAVWAEPKHPYTEALISAIPHADGAGDLPLALPGEVPDPAQPPSGCRFHPRCPHVFARCEVEDPPLYALGADRHAACFLRDPHHPEEPG
jgi:oligopeptide/dipeptide ABC transporter ATP-binding protein